MGRRGPPSRRVTATTSCCRGRSAAGCRPARPARRCSCGTPCAPTWPRAAKTCGPAAGSGRSAPRLQGREGRTGPGLVSMTQVPAAHQPSPDERRHHPTPAAASVCWHHASEPTVSQLACKLWMRSQVQPSGAHPGTGRPARTLRCPGWLHSCRAPRRRHRGTPRGPPARPPPSRRTAPRRPPRCAARRGRAAQWSAGWQRALQGVGHAGQGRSMRQRVGAAGLRGSCPRLLRSLVHPAPGLLHTRCDVSWLEGLGHWAVLWPVDGRLPGPRCAAAGVAVCLQTGALHKHRDVSSGQAGTHPGGWGRRSEQAQRHSTAAAMVAPAARAPRSREPTAVLCGSRGSPQPHLVVKAIHGKKGGQVVLGAGAVPLPAAAAGAAGSPRVQR